MPDPDGAIVLSLPREVDAATVDPVSRSARELLREPGVHTLVVDMNDVEFLDSLGLGLLVNLRELADDRGASMSLRNVPARAARIIELTGLLDHLPAE